MMIKDDGAYRYFGTLYGVFAVLKAKGLVDAGDMNDLVGYADLATNSIKKIVEASRIIVPRPDSYDGLFPKSTEEKHAALLQLLEAVETLESMSGPTAIVDKLREGVENKIDKAKKQDRQKRRSQFKVLNGGSNEGAGSDDSGG